MKKLTVIFGLALVAGVVNAQQQTVIIQPSAVTVKGTLTSENNTTLMALAVMPQGQIRREGTNVVITGQANITVPVQMVDQFVVLPEGVYATNLIGGGFTLKTNGTEVRLTFKKTE